MLTSKPNPRLLLMCIYIDNTHFSSDEAPSLEGIYSVRFQQIITFKTRAYFPLESKTHIERNRQDCIKMI